MKPCLTIPLLVLLQTTTAVQEARSGPWQFNGIPQDQGPSPADQFGPTLVSDGMGGVISVWRDTRTGDPDLFVQRTDNSGNALWFHFGVAPTATIDIPLATAISDGADGIIAVFQDFRNGVDWDIYAQRIDHNGNALWGPNGIAVCTAAGHQSEPTLVSDGAGGAIVLWGDSRPGNIGVYARRVDASGNPLWTADGVALVAAVGPFEHAGLVSDGLGGAVALWSDSRAGNWDVYARRIDGSGNPLWTPNGVALVATPEAETASRIVADGAGGALVTWNKHVVIGLPSAFREEVYTQRIDILGTPHWPAGGVAMCTAEGDRVVTAMIGDGAGGAIMAWHDYRNSANADIYLARVDATGNTPWTSDGVAMCTSAGDQLDPVLAPDGAGGAIVAWTDYRGGAVADIYAGRSDGNGAPMWIPNGIPVCADAAHQATPAIVSDDAGRVFVAWEDNRSGYSSIFMQRIDAQYGEWGHPEPTLLSVEDVAADQGGYVTVTWDASQREGPAGASLISHYSVWRRTASGGAEVVGNDIAIGLAQHQFTAPTTGNSEDNEFFVVAHALASPTISWPSDTITGQSLDNLPPPPPASLTAERLPTGGVLLRWDGVSAPDLQNYAVYRWKNPGPIQFLMSSVDTTAVDADAPNEELRYTVAARDVNDNESLPSNEAVVDPVTGIGDTPVITALTVRQNHPNPFNASTVFEIGLPVNSGVRVDVFDVAGRRVSELNVAGVKGWQRIPFAGRDQHGEPLASGVYFYRVSAASTTITKKLVIAR